ncbi:MAG: DUF3877 family protein [Butyrivibrio sp.]|nr:DUF3877 family protein [Butyrivibrio sp.]
MNFDRLKQNIIDVIKEEQLKLGYRPETVRLYYPLGSLNNFFGQKCTVPQALELLEDFCAEACGELGEIKISSQGERFCFAVPEAGAQYVSSHTLDNEFIKELIDAVRAHGCGMEEVFAVFKRHSDRLHIEKLDNGEFDWLIYFEDGRPDGYYYCFSSDGLHTTYHRFLPEDYADFGF